MLNELVFSQVDIENIKSVDQGILYGTFLVGTIWLVDLAASQDKIHAEHSVGLMYAEHQSVAQVLFRSRDRDHR